MNEVTVADIMSASIDSTLIQRIAAELNALGYDQCNLKWANLKASFMTWDSNNVKEVIVTSGGTPEQAMWNALQVARAGGWEAYLDLIGLAPGDKQ